MWLLVCLLHEIKSEFVIGDGDARYSVSQNWARDPGRLHRCPKRRTNT